MKFIKEKKFSNGSVYLLETEDGYPVEVTDTFLPYYTKGCINNNNALKSGDLGSRKERWMIGVSVMSGCNVGCKFCATGKLKKCRNLTWGEIVEQIKFIISQHDTGGFMAKTAKEFKINYTRMGEPFLNIKNVRKAISWVDNSFDSPRPIMTGGNNTHHYISTIGVKGADYSWIKDNITLQFSVHSFDEDYRDWLIPFKNKILLSEMGKVRTRSDLKTTLNLTMAREEDFNINLMQEYFAKDSFFIKISPINKNDISIANDMGNGIIKQQNAI